MKNEKIYGVWGSGELVRDGCFIRKKISVNGRGKMSRRWGDVYRVYGQYIASLAVYHVLAYRGVWWLSESHFETSSSLYMSRIKKVFKNLLGDSVRVILNRDVQLD